MAGGRLPASRGCWYLCVPFCCLIMPVAKQHGVSVGPNIVPRAGASLRQSGRPFVPVEPFRLPLPLMPLPIEAAVGLLVPEALQRAVVV